MSGSIRYEVKSGDWLAKIARDHGTTVGAIWNHRDNAAHRAKRGSPDVLYPGDVLYLPARRHPIPGTTPTPPTRRPLDVPQPWPYEDELLDREPGRPSWTCPSGGCQCHSRSNQELFEHAILLCDQAGRPMPRARARVRGDGGSQSELVDADGNGWLLLVGPKRHASYTIEWAPHQVPTGRLCPFMARYHVELTADRLISARRRLANLGFLSGMTVEDGILAFQHRHASPRAAVWTTLRPSLSRITITGFCPSSTMTGLQRQLLPLHHLHRRRVILRTGTGRSWDVAL